MRSCRQTRPTYSMKLVSPRHPWCIQLVRVVRQNELLRNFRTIPDNCRIVVRKRAHIFLERLLTLFLRTTRRVQNAELPRLHLRTYLNEMLPGARLCFCMPPLLWWVSAPRIVLGVSVECYVVHGIHPPSICQVCTIELLWATNPAFIAESRLEEFPSSLTFACSSPLTLHGQFTLLAVFAMCFLSRSSEEFISMRHSNEQWLWFLKKGGKYSLAWEEYTIHCWQLQLPTSSVVCNIILRVVSVSNSLSAGIVSSPGLH